MATPDETLRFGVLSVPVYAIRWFVCLFTVGTVYLTVANTLSVVIRTGASGWLEIQRIATVELVQAGGASLVCSVIIVEVGNLVLGEWIRQRRRARALEEGKKEGRNEAHALWLAWLRRREEAEQRGDSFDEPPPGSDNRNGSDG